MSTFRFGKYTFSSYKEFQTVQNLAIANGSESVESFEAFLRVNYSK